LESEITSKKSCVIRLTYKHDLGEPYNSSTRKGKALLSSPLPEATASTYPTAVASTTTRLRDACSAFKCQVSSERQALVAGIAAKQADQEPAASALPLTCFSNVAKMYDRPDSRC
jgi:hypothetical protein